MGQGGNSQGGGNFTDSFGRILNNASSHEPSFP
jgi:hypothetical protein